MIDDLWDGMTSIQANQPTGWFYRAKLIDVFLEVLLIAVCKGFPICDLVVD